MMALSGAGLVGLVAKHLTSGNGGVGCGCRNRSTPADWQPGEDVIVPPPGSCGTAKERAEKPAPDADALDWFMTFKKLPKDQIKLSAAAKS